MYRKNKFTWPKFIVSFHKCLRLQQVVRHFCCFFHSFLPFSVSCRDNLLVKQRYFKNFNFFFHIELAGEAENQ